MQSKIDSVLEKLSKEELCAFAEEYARVNEGFAMALIERYWMPDATDYREMVEKCFMHPRKGSGYGEALDWFAIADELAKVMQFARERREGKDYIGAAQIGGYILTIGSEMYMKDHPVKEYYCQEWAEMRAPLRKSFFDAVEMVKALLIEEDGIDDDSQRGMMKEIVADLKAYKDVPLFNADMFLDAAQEKVLSPKRYLTWVTNKIRTARGLFVCDYIKKKARFLRKQGREDEAVGFLLSKKDGTWVNTAVEVLMEWKLYEKALETMTSVDNMTDSYFGEYEEKIIKIAETIPDRKRGIEILIDRFKRTDRKLPIYNKLKETLKKKEWKAFVDDVLANRDEIFKDDYDDVEAEIYISNKMYGELIAFCNRHTFDDYGNLMRFGKYMPEEHQRILLERIVEGMKRGIAKCSKAKEYAYFVTKVRELYSISAVSRDVIKEFAGWLHENYGNRPALWREWVK